MRTTLLRGLFYFALVSGGYAAGLRWPHDQVVSNLEDGSDSNSTVASIRSTQVVTETFAEKHDRLRELSRQAHGPWDPVALAKGVRPGQLELELESIFALATQEDLVAWFAGEDSEKANTAALNAAYARYATLSLGEALAIWSDQFRQTKKADGVSGLIRTWAELDPVAAESWVMQLTDVKAKNAALFALMDEVVETSPDLVERLLVELGGDNQEFFLSIHLAARLARTVSTDELSGLADRFLAEKNDKWEYQNQLVALLEVWGERDGTAMMRWVMSQPQGRFKDHVFPRIAEARAAADPGAFLNEIAPALAGNKAMGQMAGQAWLKWLAKGGEEELALKWFETHGEHLRVSERSIWHGQNWSSDQSIRVLSHLDGLADGEIKTQATRAILNQLSSRDPKSALAYADNLPSGNDKNWFIAGSLSTLARTGQPSEALSWVVDNLEAGQGQNDAVRSVMSSWGEVNPIEAAEHVRTLPERLRKDAYDGLAYQWAERAPEQLLDYLAKTPDPASATPLAQNAFWSLGYNRSGESFLPKALALPNEAMRKQAIEGLFGGWSRANLESSAKALDTMERGELRDLAVVQFVENARWADREAAMTWAFEVSDAAKQRATVLDQGRRWLNADREAATKWIQSSETLPEEWRTELLKEKK